MAVFQQNIIYKHKFKIYIIFIYLKMLFFLNFFFQAFTEVKTNLSSQVTKTNQQTISSGKNLA